MPEVESNDEAKPAPRLGSYLLVQALGSGGMSNVFRAVHEESGNVVAVKVLPRTLAKNATLLQRFMREAKSAEALDHPNIVAIYDRGFDQGRHYLVLEYVEGKDLHDRVRANGPLGPVEAIAFIREVAEGLRYASGRGMIHRDVKPANLLMTPDGHAKIIDLGLALQIEDEDERVTRDGTTVGTVDYMAPEQARDSRQTSERSDIYSLGCTFYYLLTGSPPFPGGGLSDKLARHYKAPIPEVREHRTDVSESLSLLIRKMMEKKPELRFADYTKLIEALDTVGDPPTEDISGETLDALVLDDDDDDEIGLAPTESSMARSREDRPPSSRENLLMAEIVDDDDDVPLAPTLPTPVKTVRGREAPPRPKPVAASEPAEMSLAELAALDAGDSPAVRRQAQKSSPSTPGHRSPSNPAMSTARTPAASFAAIPPEDDDEDDEEVYGSQGPMRKGLGSEVSLKTWISAGVMVGLAIAILGFGATMLLSLGKKPAPPLPPDRPIEQASNDPEVTPPTTYVPKKYGSPIKKVIPEKKAGGVPAPPTEVAIKVAPPVVEAEYPLGWESKLAPPPPTRLVAPTDPKARAVIRRVLLAGGEAQFSALAGGLSRAADSVEIADVGPFFEDDCQVAGKSRLIRAREGLRAMIKVESGEVKVVKEQAAKFVLGGTRIENLVLEGLDIVVNVRDLPEHQSTLFLCQGADITLRDCTLTVYNANDPSRKSPFSIFRFEEAARPNRVTLERTMIRGPVGTLVDISSTRAEVVLSRSLVLGDTSPLFQSGGGDKATRSFHFYRSFLVSRGHLLDFAGKGVPPVVRSLGTTFARVEGATGSAPGLLSSRSPLTGDPATVIDWSGEDDEFMGWPGFLSVGNDPSAKVTGLDAIRANWTGSDGSSRESTDPWPAPHSPDEIQPIDLTQMVPQRRATLVKIASPPPRLRDLTIGSLARLTTPELSATLSSPSIAAIFKPAAPPPPVPKSTIVAPPDPISAGPRPKSGPVPKKGAGPAMKNGPMPKKVAAANVAPPPPGPLNLTFDVREAPWNGDLGAFLAEKLVKGTPRATITVKGTGAYAMSPIRFEDGLSVAILGESTDRMVAFAPRGNANGRVMFELHGGDLVIANLGFSAEGAGRPKHWVLSEDGILALKHCWFRDSTPGGSAAGVGSMIAFLAKGTAPIPPRAGPLEKETDRPTARLRDCLVWTTGEAITAEVGRGVVDLVNCMVISGGPAISLLPRDVARDKFEADLILDRCTIAPDKTGILLGPLTGEPTSPSRPWLVSTRNCAFPRSQPAGGAGALLMVDPDAIARGALVWQSFADAFDSLRLIAPTGPQPANIPSADVKKQWIDIWGAEHAKRAEGPTARRNETHLRYKDRERPKPGKIVPASLEVDKELTNYGVDFKDIPTPIRVTIDSSPTRKADPEAPAGKGAFGPRGDRN